MQSTCQLPIPAVRTDEARDGDGAAVSEQARDLGDAPDVLGAVARAEAQVAVQAEADVVAVEAVRVQGVGRAQERLLQRDSDGGLARGG
jgi:hypothetical protein